MTAFDTYEILGFRARVGVPDPLARQAARSILGGFGPVDAAPGVPFVPYLLSTDETGRWTVAARGVTLHTEVDFAAALATLEWQLLTDALARRRDLFHLHGAALATPDRRDGLLLIGESGSGKTTLTLGLMLRGFAPLSDDIILLDPTALTARPIRRAFHLDGGTREVLIGRAIPAGWDFAAVPPGYFMPDRWAEVPVPIRTVVFPRYEPGVPPQATRLAIPDAASALLGQTLSLARLPALSLATVARLTAQAACYRFVSGDLDAALDAIIALLAAQLDAAAPSPEPGR